MMIRKAAVAGQFYSGTENTCLQEIRKCLPAEPLTEELPQTIVAGIVPHAGWVFSGNLAGRVFAAIKQNDQQVDTFVLFGAAHRYFNGTAVVYPEGAWETPLGQIEIDDLLANRIISLGADADAEAHQFEHSIEVQVPFIQHLFPNAKIVPIIVPVVGFDHTFGTRIGQLLAEIKDKNVVCIGSTDLTHYGPRYGFCPEGTGPEAIRWAREVNDMEFIDLAIRMDDVNIVQIAIEKGNACGPAAVATTIAAAKATGAVRGVLLGHTTSSEIMQEKFHQSSEESVGYTAIVF